MRCDGVLKKCLKKFILREKYDSETYIKYLRNQGVTIGKRVNVYEPRSVCIDITRPYLIEIGNDVKITRGVTILTHGYDWSVLAGLYDEVLGSAGKVTIGNNVFIGMQTTILKGVKIGNNVIIGANSLVNKDIPNNVVVAGNPAKVIMSINDYYEKRKREQIAEVFEMYDCYVRAYDKEPTEDIFSEFFWLFHDRDEPIPGCFEKYMRYHDRYAETLRNYENSQPVFKGFREFIKAVKQEKN